jgi:glycosyltransferase involved in cell wall biosynthesis
MKKYIFLTNIPTPYRTSFYNELHECGLDFEVFYMREIESDRNWSVERESLKHPHFIDNGLYRTVGRFHVHFNPRLIQKILKSKDAEIIIGGAWNDLDVLAIVTLKRLGILKSQLHFWSEANYLTIGASNDNFLKSLIRKFVYHSSRGAQLSSGRMTEITLADKWGIKCYKFVPLPNTIEEDRFQISEGDVDKRYTKRSLPIFLMPVRLVEQDKGIINFFNCIGIENTKKAVFNIAGDGVDKERIKDFVESNCLEENVKLLGHCTAEKMASLYREANLFVLPSFSDPSPLSLIEAISMKLPVLVSERCGNHFEAVESGLNGYIFDPFNPESAKNAFEKLLIKKEQWREMGEKSKSIYNMKFDKKSVIANFVNALTSTL